MSRTPLAPVVVSLAAAEIRPMLLISDWRPGLDLGGCGLSQRLDHHHQGSLDAPPNGGRLRPIASVAHATVFVCACVRQRDDVNNGTMGGRFLSLPGFVHATSPQCLRRTNHTMVHSGALVSHYLLRPLSPAVDVATAAALVVTIVPLSATVPDHSGRTPLTPLPQSASASIQSKPSSELGSPSSSGSSSATHTSIASASAGHLLLDNSGTVAAGRRARDVRQILDRRSTPTWEALRREKRSKKIVSLAMLNGKAGGDTGLDTIANVIGLRGVGTSTLKTFVDMWYHIFLWALFSSIFLHTCAAVIAFVTLRKHKFGRFFSIFIFVMGVLSPATGGVVSSTVIAFVHQASSFQMSPIMAMIWGVGQTIVSACFGFTRILATL
uniref:Transmembrane protein 170A n=1 Tax=Anopheles atroparvus TaxID=41427 RepID=A0A182IUN4_ANOAO